MDRKKIEARIAYIRKHWQDTDESGWGEHMLPLCDAAEELLEVVRTSVGGDVLERAGLVPKRPSALDPVPGESDPLDNLELRFKAAMGLGSIGKQRREVWDEVVGPLVGRLVLERARFREAHRRASLYDEAVDQVVGYKRALERASQRVPAASIRDLVDSLEPTVACPYGCRLRQERASCPCADCLSFRGAMDDVADIGDAWRMDRNACRMPELAAPGMEPLFDQEMHGRARAERPGHQVPLLTRPATGEDRGLVFATRFASCACEWCRAVEATGSGRALLPTITRFGKPVSGSQEAAVLAAGQDGRPVGVVPGYCQACAGMKMDFTQAPPVVCGECGGTGRAREPVRGAT